jgi:hypothetical protein
MNDGRTGSGFHWAGDLDPWQGILLAVAAAILAWWLYRLETGKTGNSSLNKLLPILRATAVALIVLTLVGPTIRTVDEEGERGRVLVFLDSSQSMSIKDSHMSNGRKLLLALRHGWLPEDQNLLDPALQDASDLLAEARITLNQGLEDPAANLVELSQSFTEKTKQAADLLAGKDFEVPQNLERQGVLYHELWKNISGGSITNLTNHAKFKENPDSTGYLKAAESPVNVGSDFGRRIRGVLVAPASGEYRFSISGDDECQLRINTAGDNPKSPREIVRSDSPVTLVQSHRYYFEILHKEAGGDDYCSVGWTLPDGRQESPIPGKHFRAPNYDTAPKFAEVSEKMRAEVVEAAKRIKPSEGSEDAIREELSKLAETALSYENRFRDTFDSYAENLASSDNESIQKAIRDFNAAGRWERASRLLTERNDSILKELSQTHLIEVRSLSGPESERLWDNGGGSEPPKNFQPGAFSSRTDIASGLRSTMKADDEDETFIQGEVGKKSRSAAVILSDGLHNEGASPFETAKLLAGRDLPIHTIGLGNDAPPPDLAVLKVETPTKVLKDDRMKGSITLKDNLQAGVPFKIVVENEQGDVVWEKSDLKGMNAMRRRVDFDFSMEKWVEKKIDDMGLDNSVEVNSIPFRMKVTVQLEDTKKEVNHDNNFRSFSFDAITKKNRMLIIDGRPRWETRYLKNLFERDERWSATAVFAEPGSEGNALPRGEQGDVFPTDKKTLFSYDLIVFGEVDPQLLNDDEQGWLRDFVANRGGGMLLLDGPRQHFREYAEDEENQIASLLPVKWADKKEKDLPVPLSFRLTERGLGTTALFLHSNAERSAELWGYVPKPGWVAPTEALPGTEVYLEATLDKDGEQAVPLLVSRTLGAGKVLYSGFDGTWLWRYEVTDKYHQRYWHQVAAWIMEQPFAVSDDFVAIDPGASSYRPGQTAALRVRVRDREGKPLDDPNALVEALVFRDDKIVATIPMESAPESGGLFRGNTPALATGKHKIKIRIKGIFEENEIRSIGEFTVREPESPELATLTCNEELLKEMAKLSGGRYLREEQIGRLNELLKPISSGRLVTTEIALWQSYWWFAPIVLLLGIELFLRKRAGML